MKLGGEQITQKRRGKKDASSFIGKKKYGGGEKQKKGRETLN